MLNLNLKRLIGLFIVVAFGLVACGSDDNEADASQNDNTLRLGVAYAAVTFDPHLAPTSSDEDDLNLFYDTLFKQTAEGRAVPELVESFEFTDEGLLLHLLDGVVFHDGNPFNSDAVKANIERGQTLEGSKVTRDLTPVVEVEVVDPLTVLLKTERTDVTLPAVLTGRAGMMISPAAFDSDLASTAVGAGMFKMTSRQVGVKISGERWDGYWNPEAVDLGGIEVHYFQDAGTRMNALRSGQIDAARLQPSQIAEAKGHGLIVEETLFSTTSVLQFNIETVPAWNDERVRHAVNHALDREAIVAGVLDGHGAPTFQMFGQASIAHDPDLEEPYPYDPDRARELLAEAGYADGFEFEVMFGTTPSLSELEAVQGFLADVGITMKIRVIQGAEGVKIMWGEKAGEALALPFGTSFDPSLNLGYFLPDQFRNPGGLTSEAVAALIEASMVETDPDARVSIQHEISAELAANPLALVPLHSVSGAFATSEGVSGLRYLPSTRYYLDNVALVN